MDLKDFVRKTFSETRDFAARNADDEALHDAMAQVAKACADTLSKGGRLISFGNGGSLCDASHFAEELSGRYRDDRPPLSALCINDAGHITCTGNDYGYDQIFARGVEAHARSGDVVLGFTTSGNSGNVLEAFKLAGTLGVKRVGFLGRGGGRCAEHCDWVLMGKGQTADRVQEQHIQMVHMLIEMIERQLYPENYAEKA